jgi:hypothetical protein
MTKPNGFFAPDSPDLYYTPVEDRLTRDQTSLLRATPRWNRGASVRALDLTLAGVLLGAGTIHAILIPEHFAESVLFGAVFTAMAAFQFGLAVALVTHPGPGVYRTTLLGSVVLLAVWAGTRFFAPPSGSEPEDVDIWGVVATGLELGAVVLVATIVPSRGILARHRLTWSAAGALGFAVIYLLASGSAGYVDEPIGRPFVEVYPVTGEFSITVPALAVYVAGGRAFVTLPWSTGVFLPIASVLIAAQVYLALGLTGCAPRLGARRRGVVSLIPAVFAAPVCCGAPLLSFLGTSATISLSQATPLLLVATVVLLLASTWRLAHDSRRLRHGSAAPGD